MADWERGSRIDLSPLPPWWGQGWLWGHPTGSGILETSGQYHQHPWDSSWFLPSYCGHTEIIFFYLFSPTLQAGAPCSAPDGAFKAVGIASGFCSPDKGAERKATREERRVCFVLMRIWSPPAGETAGVLSCPSSPALAWPVLHLLAAAGRGEGFAEPGISGSPQFGFLLGASSGSLPAGSEADGLATAS